MASLNRESLYLNRRVNVRVDHRNVIRFVRDSAHRLSFTQGLSQNISLNGIQILSPRILEKNKPFELWIPIKGQDDNVLALAQTAWIQIEDSLGDSPYWIRSGLRLSFNKAKDRDLYRDMISQKTYIKTPMEHAVFEEPGSKVGFVLQS